MGVTPANSYAPLKTTSPVRVVVPDFLIALSHWVYMFNVTALKWTISVTEAPQNLYSLRVTSSNKGVVPIHLIVLSH